MSDPTDEFRIINTGPGETPTTVCPHCGEEGRIEEEDSAIRWNRLEFTEGEPLTPTAHTGNSGDWEFTRFLCIGCLTEVTPPPELEIKDWI